MQAATVPLRLCSEGGMTMAGCFSGYPNDWRKGVFKRAHTVALLKVNSSLRVGGFSMP